VKNTTESQTQKRKNLASERDSKCRTKNLPGRISKLKKYSDSAKAQEV
jgi:hypothetical protein